MRTYIIYHTRWQVSAIFMFIPLWFLNEFFNMNPFLNLMILQFIGALFFWKIDNYIFKGDKIEA